MVMAKDAKFHVLAVDDSLMDRKLIETLLRTSSYQVTAVDSGSKALQVLGLEEDEQSGHEHQPQEVEINLIITDYCMPGMTGYDLLRKIKESSSLRDIPVVIMSSENNPSRISRCLEEGAEDFFLKPVQMSDVSKLRPHLMKGKGKESEREGGGMRESLQMCLSTVAERTSRAILGKNSAGLEFGNGLRMSYTSTCSDNLLKWRIQITVSIFFLLILVFPSWIVQGYMLN